MEIEQLQDFVDRRIALFFEKRFDDLANHFSFPHVIFDGDDRSIIQTKKAATIMFEQLFAAQRSRGTVSVRAKILNVDEQRGRRFLLWTQYTELDNKFTVTAKGEKLEYCRETRHGFQVEISDTTETAYCPSKATTNGF